MSHTMMNYNATGKSLIKTTTWAWQKKTELVSETARNVYSLDIPAHMENEEENPLLDCIGSVDVYDGIFYFELNRFINLMPEDIQDLMRCYYQDCIELLDEQTARLETAKKFKISSLEMTAISERWNPELYDFLCISQEGNIKEFHSKWEEQHPELKLNTCDLIKNHRPIYLVKDGDVVSAKSVEMARMYLAQGYVEQRLETLDDKKTNWVSNGEIAFPVRSVDLKKFESIGFTRGSHNCDRTQKGKMYRVTDGIRVEKVAENHLKYWEQIGYHVVECIGGKGRKDYIGIWKGKQEIRVPKEKLQRYLDDGWAKGGSVIKVCNQSGDKKKIRIWELEESLDSGLGFVSTKDNKKKKLNQENLVLINNAFFDIYIQEKFLQEYLSAGWEKGTCITVLYVPNAKSKNSRYATKVRRAVVKEYLDKGYTLDVIKE